MRATQFAVPSRIVPHRAKSYVIENGRAQNVGYGDLTYKFASGGMMSTAEDLVLFGTALNRGELLKSETLARMYTPQIEQLMEFRDGKPSEVKATGQGLMWRIGKDDAGRRTVSHSGAVQQFHTCLVNYPDDDVVVAMDANSYESPACKENLAFADMFLPPPATKK
jgi:CubicO group peptidase (beta-lactamase class C family)